MSASFSPAEQRLQNAVFAQGDPQGVGILSADAAVKVLSAANLPPATLGEIWAIADSENNGYLTKRGVQIALRLVGWAQSGETPSVELTNKPGPLAKLQGINPTPASPAPRSPPPALRQPVGGVPPLKHEDRTKFTGIFNSCGPVNGLITGDQARDLFIKSNLPLEKLGQIWNLADTQSRGSLDQTDFILGMYFIQLCMTQPSYAIPPTLPPGLYEQAKGEAIRTHPTGGSASLGSPSLMGSFSAPIKPQYTGPVVRQQYTGTPVQTHHTGQTLTSQTVSSPTSRLSIASTSSPFPLAQQATGALPWDVTSQEKATADMFFDQLDTQKRGYIEGDTAVNFMLKSNLPEMVLAQIWDLSDLHKNGQLTRDGFAVAMHLINGKLAGKEVPAVLPTSLIPPGLRNELGHAAVTAPTPAQEIQNDLLLLADTPPASANQPAHPFSPQHTGATTPTPSTLPPLPSRPSHVSFTRDLMGDDEPITSATSVPDHSVQIGNLQNQLNSTNQSLNSTKASRVSLEQDISNSASMLAQLETQLALAKASYETESRLLSDLRERYAKLQADIKTTREQLIRAESDLSAMRVEKTEIEGHVLRDKEEIRDLQRKMKQVADETELVKKDLEKAKKDVRHQKGLLAINKKQLVTAETERDKVEKELEVENKELELVNTELEAAQKAEQQEAAHFKKDIEQTPEAFLTPLESLSPVGSPVINAGSKNPFAAFAAASASGGLSMSNQPSGPFLPFGTPSSPPVEPTSLNSPTTSQIHDDPFGIASTTASAPVSTPPPIASQIASPTGVATPVRAASPVNRVSTPVLVPQRVGSPIRTGSPVARVGSPLARAVTTSTPPPGHGSRSSTPQIVPTPPQPTSATTSPPKADNAEKPAGQEAETKFPSLDVLGGVTPLEDKDELDLELPPLKEIEEADEDTSSEEDSDDYADARVNGAKAAPVATATTSTQQEEHKKESTSSSAFDDAFGTGTERSSGSGVQVSPPSIGSFPETGTWNNEAIKESNNTTPTPLTIEPAATTTTSAISGASAFDDAFGWKPLDTPATTAQNGSTVPSTMSVPGGFKFDTSFDEGFDFNSFANEAAPAAPAPAPAPLAASSSAFDDAFGVSKAAPARPTGTFSFDDAFGVKVPASGPSISPAPQQASAVPSLPTLSFDDAFGVSGLTPQPSVQPPQEPAQEPSPSYSPFSTGPLMPGMSPISTSAPVSASAPTPTTYAPPAGPPPGVTLPPRPSSPSGSNSFTSPTRQSTTTDRSASPKPSHKESPTSLRVKAPDAGPRPVSSLFGSSSSSPPPGAPAPAKSKFHFPGFGRSKTTKKRAKSPAPEPVPTPSGRFGRSTSITSATDAAAAGEDVEGVKQICAMGFTRDQAVTALERHSYNVARALESLLEENPGTT